MGSGFMVVDMVVVGGSGAGAEDVKTINTHTYPKLITDLLM